MTFFSKSFFTLIICAFSIAYAMEPNKPKASLVVFVYETSFVKSQNGVPSSVPSVGESTMNYLRECPVYSWQKPQDSKKSHTPSDR